MDGSISFRYNPSLPLSLFLLHCYLSLYPAAIEKGNELLLKHHPGVYGLTNKDRWSCCGRARRECEGCSDSRGALKMLGKSPDGKYREEEKRRREREMMCLCLVELKSVITLKTVQTVIDPFV